MNAMRDGYHQGETRPGQMSLFHCNIGQKYMLDLAY